MDPSKQLTLTVLRPDDLLALSVRTVNLRLDASRPGRPRLVRDTPGQPAYLVIAFPPQSIAEQAFFETALVNQPAFNPPTPSLPKPPPLPGGPETPLAPGTVAAWPAGESRLVFRLPSAVQEIDYSIAGLLDWSLLEPVLPPAARMLPGAAGTPSGPPIAEPGALETSLELPYRLIMSPNVMPGGLLPGWEHAAVPVLHAGRAELWHTRLGSRAGGDHRAFTEASTTAPVPVRAVWSPNFVADGLPTPDTSLTVAMSASDRDQIVILTSGFSGYTLSDAHGARPYVPAPVDASRLFLSALGGWLTSRGAWQYPVTKEVRAPVREPVREPVRTPVA